MYYLGLDIGSSSIKAALVEAGTGNVVATVKEPENEMEIIAHHVGWAEQNPEMWWNYVCKAIARLKHNSGINAEHIKGIGISYQMHGLVLLDKKGSLLRDAIIWCDSRAVAIGRKAFDEIGEHKCSTQLLNSPANFTMSKLKWVKDNQPEIYEKIHKIMLPGDYIAYRLSGLINTTVPGLSEGIVWDFKENTLAGWLLDHYELDEGLIPDVVPSFSIQSTLSEKGAKESGLAEGTPILYRAGDQPNNALSLNVFNPGEVAATGGTSGVVYAVTDKVVARETTRINSFAHVNHSTATPRIGKLLNINGAGIQYRWLKENIAVSSYEEMNSLASDVAIGAEGVAIIPFGNGSERMLNNRIVGTHISNINLNIHNKGHLCRAAVEGIAFSFVYGIEILKADGVTMNVLRVGNDNLFRSEIFANTIATLIDHEIEVFNTTGAIGAARACHLIQDNLSGFTDSIMKNDHVKTFVPLQNKASYIEAYHHWKKILHQILNT